VIMDVLGTLVLNGKLGHLPAGKESTPAQDGPAAR